MDALQSLQSFAKSLSDKGYTGVFLTQGAYPGRLEESLLRYLQCCYKGTEPGPQSDLLLNGYLQWSGEDRPYVECCMHLRYQSGSFSLKGMEVSRRDQYGQLLKVSQLHNLSVFTVPKAEEAIALVAEVPPANRRRLKRGL